MDDKTLLAEAAKQMGLSLNETQMAQFFQYRTLLLQWNEKMNLTAITDPTEVVIKHFIDCLSLLQKTTLPTGATVIDVGTGAGFPGLPIKIARPDLQVTLLDSLQKRIGFLETVVEGLGLTGVTCIHSRAEDGGQNPQLREQFDFCLSRAVANLAVLAEYSLPFVKVGGALIALKGPDGEREVEEGKKAVTLLGGGKPQIMEVEVPFSDLHHCLIVIQKEQETPKKYPRKAGTATKKPLH